MSQITIEQMGDGWYWNDKVPVLTDDPVGPFDTYEKALQDAQDSYGDVVVSQ